MTLTVIAYLITYSLQTRFYLHKRKARTLANRGDLFRHWCFKRALIVLVRSVESSTAFFKQSPPRISFSQNLKVLKKFVIVFLFGAKYSKHNKVV